MDFILQPNIYRTTSGNPTLMSLLDKIWISYLRDNNKLGIGTIYILSGFSNFNGGVPYYNFIERHIKSGGECRVILGGSSSQNMSSKQVVKKLLEIGCKVAAINRKAIFHAKCYGYQSNDYKSLIVSSGNFTSRGLAQNIEASILLEGKDIAMKFDWNELFDSLEKQKIEYYQASLDENNPIWNLLFDEEKGRITNDDLSLYQTMILTLSHTDTKRIQAERGSKEGVGTQYFWLSKDSIEFFPPLDMKNARGTKNAYRTEISMNFIDIGVQKNVSVTYEADNNRDFRLLTGPLIFSKIANDNDIAAITRKSFNSYELRIIKRETTLYGKLLPYATIFIGNQGKKYGYISNKEYNKLLKQ